MKIISLMENTTHHNLIAEHGLSLYIETNNHKILFDFGQTNAFIENALKLNVDLKNVDIAILSHGHYDHSGGLFKFLEINDHALVYVHPLVFEKYYNGTEKYIGVCEKLKDHQRLVLTDDYFKINEECELWTCNDLPCIYPIDSAGLRIKQESFLPDTFQHEQYLVIHDEKKVVISGCSHKGIVNIVNWLKPDVLIGGFHYKKQNIVNHSNTILDEASEELMKHECIYYTCHCTGLEQYLYLKERMNDQLYYLACGDCLEI